MAKVTLKRLFSINAAGALVPLVVSLITVPIYLRHMGSARYGVLSIVWLLLGYFGFLDLGLSKAAANALARLSDAPQLERARILVTALMTNLGLGLIGSLFLLVGGATLLDHILNVPADIRQETQRAFLWVVPLFPLALITGVGVGALESRERFGLANLLQVTGGSAGQILSAALVALWHPTLEVAIPASVIARAATVIAILAVVSRLEGPLRPAHFDRGAIPQLLRYGGWVTVSSVMGPILGSIDQFLISSLASVALLPYYAVPMTLVLRSQVFPAALSRTLFPRMTSVTQAASHELASRAFTVVTFGYAAICAPAMILSPLFFRVWLGGPFAEVAAPIAVILFIGAWFNAVAFVPYGLMEARGRPEVPGKYHAAEVIPFVVILWALTARFGIQGAAIAWSFRCCIDALLLVHAARMHRHDVARAGIALLLLCAAGAAALFLGVSPLALPFAAATAVVAIVIAIIQSNDLRRFARAAFARPALN